MTETGRLDQTTFVALRAEPAADPASPPVLLDLQALFKMHSGYVWNSLRRLGVPTPDLEDLTHDVFLRVHGNLDQYDPGRPIRPWLFGFAFRVASQHRRRAHRRHDHAAEVDAIADPHPLADHALAAEEDRRLVAAALGRVPLERRAVFVLYEIDDVGVDEIARALEIPANTVYSRLRAARAEFADAVRKLDSARRRR